MKALTLVRKLRAAGLIVAGLAAALPPLATSAQSQQTVSKINKYLNDLGSMKGKFLQIAPDGVISEGEYWMRRPGRLRFEYQNPTEIKVIADGFWIAIIDEEFDQSIDRFPLSETPLNMLLKEDVDLAAEGAVRRVEEGEGQLRITAIDPEAPELGEVTLVFDADPIALKQWIVTDAQGLTTSIALRTTEVNIDVENALFVIPEAEAGGGSRQQQ